jgi:cytoskeleton protein RodZ
VEVQVDGTTAISRILTAGETQRLEAQSQIVLSVGNAGGISFTINDRPGIPLGREGEVKHNIVITKDSVPALIQQGTAAPGSPAAGAPPAPAPLAVPPVASATPPVP